MTTQEKSLTTTAVSFTEQIRAALNHFAEPDWLGEQSPLAAPYFLGTALGEAVTAVQRGEALQAALISAADRLWNEPIPETRNDLETAVQDERKEQGNKGLRYHYLLLELRYFRRFFRPADSPTADNDIAICDYLSISRASYFNHLKAAQQTLGDALLAQLQPTFRLEQPLHLPAQLIGREALITHSLEALQAGQSVALSGMGGSGKTTLAAAVAQAWPHAVFWYTLRPAFNDQLDGLIFSLAAFLHQNGASQLWQQLVADGSVLTNYALILALIRQDLAHIPPPLFCFDEIDVLHAEDDLWTETQVQLREFIDSLRPHAPLLVLGQHHSLYLDRHFEVPNLTLPQQIAFLADWNITLSPVEQHRLYEYANGNPRLLLLCTILINTGMPLQTILTELPQTAALRALWERLWQRLQPDERALLQRIAVFRSPAPADGWGEAQAALLRLQERALVQTDNAGGLALLPAFRDLLLADWQRFPQAQREAFHLLAADMRASRGEFTAVAYHLIQANEAALAVHLWYPQRQLEIRRGFATAALALFQQLSERHLPQEEQQALALIRAELLQLTGQAQEGLQQIEAVSWPPNSELTVRAALLRGDFLNELGYPQQALNRYEDGIAVITRLWNRLVRLRYQRGTVFVQQKMLDAARQEAQMAQHEAAFLQGMVADEYGRYEQAITFYQQALQLAEQIGYEKGVAQTHRALATTFGRQAKLDEVKKHAQVAINYFAQIGDRLNQERLNSTLAATFFQAGQFEEAIAVAEPTVAYFAEMGLTFWTAVTAATLAEAYYETRQFDLAIQTAQKVMALEENQTQPYALHTLGMVTSAQGDPALAGKYFQQSQQIATANGDRFMAAYAWRALGQTQLAQNRSIEAKEALQQAIELFTSLNLAHEVETTQALFPKA